MSGSWNFKYHAYIVPAALQCGVGEASCAKSVTLELGEDVIRLDHNHQLFLNGREVKTLPAEIAGVKIFMVSSLFIQVSWLTMFFTRTIFVYLITIIYLDHIVQYNVSIC